MNGVTVPLMQSGSVVLNAQGTGQVSLGPTIPGVTWTPAAGSCITSTAVNTPVFQVYLNTVGQASFQGGSETGNNDTCAVGAVTLYPGMTLIGVWSGGDPGATATFNLSGTATVPGS